jgi:Protein of unknown function (DUF2892)
MKKNVGIKDANIRTLIAAVLILVVFFFVKNPYMQIFSALVSAILAGTAFLRTCPMYSILHKNTCEEPSLPTAHTDTPPTPSTESIEKTVKE